MRGGTWTATQLESQGVCWVPGGWSTALAPSPIHTQHLNKLTHKLDCGNQVLTLSVSTLTDILSSLKTLL